MTYRRIAVAVSVAFMAVSGSAQASIDHGSARVTLATSNDRHAPCRSLARQSCSNYQEKLLQIVQEKQAQNGNRTSMVEVGRVQLDALIASING